MKEIKKAESIPFPRSEPQENFKFDAITDTGTITIAFKWLNERWNCWITLPSGEVRQASVYPNVISWEGFNDYGFVFMTELAEIDYNSLFLTQMVIIQWQ